MSDVFKEYYRRRREEKAAAEIKELKEQEAKLVQERARIAVAAARNIQSLQEVTLEQERVRSLREEAMRVAATHEAAAHEAAALNDLDYEEMLALALAMSMEDSNPSSSATRAATSAGRQYNGDTPVRGIIQSTIETKELENNLIMVGTRVYRRIEYGSVSGEHYNLCGYLSLSSGDGHAAVRLKEQLAPLANAIAHDLGRYNVNFADLRTMMENEVIWAYVDMFKTPVCVYSFPIRQAVTYRTNDCRHAMVYLHCSGNHFQRLDPITG